MMLMSPGARLSSSQVVDACAGFNASELILLARHGAAYLTLWFVALEGLERTALFLFACLPTYYSAEVQANSRFQERLQREAPLGCFVCAKEDAGFVAYLCSDLANCFVGQVFSVSGGWAIR